MREILFRGKRKDTSEWTEGLTVFKLDKYVYMCKSSMCEITYDLQYNIKAITSKNPFFVEVIPETVGQFTGLTDRNGRKIFEGDIIKYIYEPGEGFWNANQKSVIVWDSTGFKLDGIMGTNKYALLQGWLVSVPYASSLFEVIGNIHDNPELMGGERK